MTSSLDSEVVGSAWCWILLWWALCWDPEKNPVLTFFSSLQVDSMSFHVLSPGIGKEVTWVM